MKKALIAAPLLLLAACAGNGWDALPVDEKGTCYQVTEWKNNGWTTHHTGLGTFCHER